MLEELLKALGLSGSAGATQTPKTPVPVRAAPAMSDIPAQSMTPEANTFTPPKDVPYWKTPAETIEGYEGLTIPQGVGRAMGGVADLASDFATEVAVPGVNTGVQIVSDAGEAVGTSILDGIDGIKGGFNTSDIPKPELVAAAASVNDVVAKKPAVKDILDTAATIDPSVVKKLTPEQQAEVDKAAAVAADALLNKDDNDDPQSIMEGAAGLLGSLFEDKAIQQALMYYTGARLMGYSGSGSGMAAGQVLLKGWDNKAKTDLLTAKADEKKAANDAIDMSKSVTMFDTRTKKKVSGFGSKSGKFVAEGSDKVTSYKDSGLVPYNTDVHRTFEEIDTEMVSETNAMVASTLANIKSSSGDDGEKYTTAGYQQVDELFGDGEALRRLLLHTTRSMKEAGVDYNTPEFKSAFASTIQRNLRDVASGKYSESDAPAMSDLIGKMTEGWLKADLTGEGPVPSFVLGKAEWGEDGTVSYDKDFTLHPEDSLKLHKQSTLVTSSLIDEAVRNGNTPAKARHLITKTKTIKKLAKIFKDEVMSDKTARIFWTEHSSDSKIKTNAFNAWLSSSQKDIDDKFMGMNNASVKDKVSRLYDEDFQTKKK